MTTYEPFFISSANSSQEDLSFPAFYQQEALQTQSHFEEQEAFLDQNASEIMGIANPDFFNTVDNHELQLQMLPEVNYDQEIEDFLDSQKVDSDFLAISNVLDNADFTHANSVEESDAFFESLGDLDGAVFGLDSFAPSPFLDMGPIASKISNHWKYCKGETVAAETNVCCDDMFSPAASFDFQIHQSSLSGCDCQHKKVYWISLRSTRSYGVVGEVGINESKILAPLVLGGFIRLVGQVVNDDEPREMESPIPFSILVELNLDFTTASISALTLEQCDAFLMLKSLVTDENCPDQFDLLLQDVSKRKQAVDVPPTPCDQCVLKASKPNKSVSKRKSNTVERKSPSAGNSIPTSATVKRIGAPKGAENVRSLLDQRRRERFKEQIATCSDKEATKLAEVILESSNSFFNIASSMYTQISLATSPKEKICRAVFTAITEFEDGRSPLEAVGRIMAVTQVVYNKLKDFNGNVGKCEVEVTRLSEAWEVLFDGFQNNQTKKVLSVSLGRKLARDLLLYASHFPFRIPQLENLYSAVVGCQG